MEIELTGITREQAARAIGEYLGFDPVYTGGAYDAWTVQDPEGKLWKLMSDASIRSECRTSRGYLPTGDRRYRVEMVTPKLTYSELPRLQECIRCLRRAGGKVNSSCGMHVHVDAANHNRQSLKNLIGIMYSKEDILFKALKVNEARAARWCRKVREPMLRQARQLSADETKDLTQLEEIWYEGYDGSREHYNWTRYYALNLHSVFYRGTVEWRCFNSTLHAGRAAAYRHPRSGGRGAADGGQQPQRLYLLPHPCHWPDPAGLWHPPGRTVLQEPRPLPAGQRHAHRRRRHCYRVY